MLCDIVAQSFVSVLLNLFLCAMRASLASVVEVCMGRINTHMSMHAMTTCMAEAIFTAPIDDSIVTTCRGMLSGPSHTPTGTVQGAAEAGGGGIPSHRRGEAGRRGGAGDEEDGRSAGDLDRNGGRVGDEGYNSEAD